MFSLAGGQAGIRTSGRTFLLREFESPFLSILDRAAGRAFKKCLGSVAFYGTGDARAAGCCEPRKQSLDKQVMLSRYCRHARIQLGDRMTRPVHRPNASLCGLSSISLSSFILNN